MTRSTTSQHGTEPLVPGAAPLRGLGIAAPAGPPASAGRFPDGGAWRLEIPSVEGPVPLAAVAEEAARLGVPVHRVSQGSGVMMLSDTEIRDMVALCAESDIELCLFLGPRGTWDIGGGVRSSSGAAGPRARGYTQLAHCLADAERAAALGVRNLLVADEGVLWACHRLRERAELPGDLRFKVSVLSAPVNPVSFALLGQLGADSVNVPSDLTVGQVAELRAASPLAMDFYLEAPDDVGGFVRLHDAAELIRVGAPLYLKLGLRNAPGLYPVGRHLLTAATETARERVRRARLVLDRLDAFGADLPGPSPRPASALPRPVRLVPVAEAADAEGGPADV
ncbi:hypothetical protein [Streptomyces tremellae]|uniref:Peptidase n=1 Tax=Streptomyces tremellae TaxID=1124239 RepID=A0ABP7F5A5_9ACTN